MKAKNVVVPIYFSLLSAEFFILLLVGGIKAVMYSLMFYTTNYFHECENTYFLSSFNALSTRFVEF